MRRGQVLLITVMLLATVLTIVLSLSFKSVTETQTTKLEQESQKALSAAESAIEVTLKNNANSTIGAGSLSNITGFSGSATIQAATSPKFTTPEISTNGSYTFYLEDYNPVSGTLTGPSDNHDITLCFQSGSTNPAIEVTLIKASAVLKYVIDPSSRITGASTGSVICTGAPDSSYNLSTTIPGTDVGADGKFLQIKVLYASTKLFFSRATNFPIQGRTISSQATSSTSTGVSKKVVLFQSYPQIPSEFFSTTF